MCNFAEIYTVFSNEIVLVYIVHHFKYVYDYILMIIRVEQDENYCKMLPIDFRNRFENWFILPLSHRVFLFGILSCFTWILMGKL